ncbi:molecular chaperone HtpG [Berryella wangjianweii]|uniref:Chaperone protein HtpG n=1 Tax=Berryella wangjianweii TaxID=2734634 RepID=A0A6M8J586_9ACTN|nr:molecular chaperone HtpG [Berryella wangjianweii]QKF07783.1 molecular chaperone HtpG [Berryella wangjianweii]
MRKFKTESRKLLDLMINSIYTNREIFLRELISNASDAVDKRYFTGLTNEAAQVDRGELAITLAFDPQARTITVSDNGIGMSRDDLERNLGTIAHSGSAEFKAAKEVAASDEAQIIGQFGVGFYSSFMVASHVRVVSRAFGSDEAWAWESDGVEGYTIEPAERAACGTDVILTVKEGDAEDGFDGFLTEWGLRDLVRRYSNYVRYPVRMEVTRTRPVEQPADEADKAADKAADGASGEASSAATSADEVAGGDAPEAPAPSDAADASDEDAATPRYETYTEVETLNSMVPIWKRRRSEVTTEELDAFYQSDFHDYEAPLKSIGVHAEGSLSYDALLFVPSHAPFDMYSRDYEKGLALYSSNVLIMDKCPDLLPDHFMFVRGVVDSADLALNISRETLQRNSQLRAIASKVEKKIGAELAAMRDGDREAYERFFQAFGRCLKFGIYTSYGAKAADLADLMLFHAAAADRMQTLREYADAMPEGQEAIYYAFGESREHLARLPLVRAVREKGYDVLLCTEDIDEFCLKALGSYAEHPFVNVADADLDLATQEERDRAAETERENAELLSAIRAALGDEVEKVTVSARVLDVPAALSTTGSVSLEMERLLARMPEGGDVRSERVLELNPQHRAFTSLQAAQRQGDADRVGLYAKLLYNQALLIEGMPIPDPLAFAEQISELMQQEPHA